MKFLSLFTKTPQHQRFNYVPRFYDPQKEEMEEREKRIKEEIEKEKGVSNEDDPFKHRTRMAGAFQAARKRGNPKGVSMSSTMIRLSILLFLTIFIIAYLEYGKPALYSLILIVPFYLYLRFKSR
jgi:Flp pilus assembly protein TadB